MKPKRIFQVYREEIDVQSRFHREEGWEGDWRWRLIASRNGQTVGGSQEAFDSRGNALRAARREASFYQPGVAAVQIQEA